MSIEQHLKRQAELHPSMQAQDVTKLCHQAAFGAEHLLAKGDVARVREYFFAEHESVRGKPYPLYEEIGTDVCRVNLAAWKHKPEWLFDLFVMSANSEKSDSSTAMFIDFMETAKKLGFAVSYAPDNIRPVHHSAEYRENEKPAYRVVSGSHARLVPLLNAMANDSAESPARIIAIDGRSASGKTTIASILAEITGAGIIHMDDFFPPAELRTPERFAKPGGNIHHERFAEEVLPHLRNGKTFSYRKFDCTTMTFNGTSEVAASPWRIVEGAYSCHPILGKYMDLSVFSDITPPEQLARIKNRNGEKRATEYDTKWIPLEEEYLQACQIKETANIRLK